MTVEDVAPGGQAPEVFRYYELAKKQEWQVRDMPWGDLPPIPETTGSKERVEKRRGIWRSVITQQLQADSLAVEMAAQLLEMARHHDAKLYYSTMAQDEARHVEAWLKLIGEAGGPTERDPYLDKLAQIFLGLDSLEEKVFLMQVFFERMIIPRFRLIARSAPDTVLADLCRRLTIDDGIHHSSGMAYERVLLRTASKQDEGSDDQGRRENAPDLRRPRPLAAEGARLHHERDAHPRSRARQGRGRGGRQDRIVARSRRARHRVHDSERLTTLFREKSHDFSRPS